jgi:hypothetical protein
VSETAARQSPGAALVDYLVTAYGLAGFERDLTFRLDVFAAEAVTAERERCAKIAEAWQKANNRRYGDDIGENIAAAIRNTP